MLVLLWVVNEAVVVVLSKACAETGDNCDTNNDKTVKPGERAASDKDFISDDLDLDHAARGISGERAVRRYNGMGPRMLAWPKVGAANGGISGKTCWASQYIARRFDEPSACSRRMYESSTQ